MLAAAADQLRHARHVETPSSTAAPRVECTLTNVNGQPSPFRCVIGFGRNPFPVDRGKCVSTARKDLPDFCLYGPSLPYVVDD